MSPDTATKLAANWRPFGRPLSRACDTPARQREAIATAATPARAGATESILPAFAATTTSQQATQWSYKRFAKNAVLLCSKGNEVMRDGARD